MSKTTRMIRTIVPTPMYMTFPLVAVNAGRRSAPPTDPRTAHSRPVQTSRRTPLESSPLAPLSTGADNEWQHFSCELNRGCPGPSAQVPDPSAPQPGGTWPSAANPPEGYGRAVPPGIPSAGPRRTPGPSTRSRCAPQRLNALSKTIAFT